MYNTTGFTKAELTTLCSLIYQSMADEQKRPWPPILGLYKALVVALTYLRKNRIEAELAETYGVSQPTISRAVTGLTPILGRALADYVPTAEDLDPDTQYVVDGTLLPCWSWHDHPELYSGKHHTTGKNVQIACTLSGRLAWASDPIDGRRHDSYCIQESGLLITRQPGDCIGDKGYIGNDMLTPIKKPQCRKLLDWEKEFNRQIGKVRYVIEQAIANLKTWRILHTDYRRPLRTFDQTIATVIALEFYRMAPE